MKPIAIRRGISLMEVLISMFVLAIGLLGVAALIPAGRHEIVEATKLETAAMVGRNAFKDIQVRGYLDPTKWSRRYDRFLTPLSPDRLYTPEAPPPFVLYTGNSNTVAYAIDPLGRTAIAGDYTSSFPYGASSGASFPSPLYRMAPFPSNSVANARGAYDVVFRGSSDLITQPNAKNKDLPPNQRYFDSGGTLLRRASNGDYSWMATITADPTRPAIGGDVNVAVAVFYKRDLSQPGAGERFADVNFPVSPMTSGGEAVLSNFTLDATGKVKPLKPGQWIMFAGFRPLTPPNKLDYYRWYRVLSAASYDSASGTQRVTLAGQDWTLLGTNTKVWIVDNIVNVYEKAMPLEIN